MSTSLFCRTALTGAAPSARGGGGGVSRLLPGRCSRAPPGAGLCRGVGFITLSPTTMAPPPSKPKVTCRLVCTRMSKATDPWDSDGYKGDQDEIHKSEAELSKELEYFRSYGDEDDEFGKYYAALCKQTEAAMPGLFIDLPPALSEEEMAEQEKLKEIAQRCMDLQADAMRRLRPEQRRPLYLMFRTVHLAFTSVKVRAMAGLANWGVSSLLIVDKLDVVRKMVSSACSAPLPLDDKDKQLEQLGSLLTPLVEEAIAGLGVDSNSSLPDQEVTFALIEYTYNTVKSDIDKMITASATSTS